MGALRAKPAIIIATPGRLVDHLERKTLALADVRIFVLDEADRMLDMGFKPQLDKIMRGLPAERQTLLFSATMPPDLGALARMHLRNPVTGVGRPAGRAAARRRRRTSTSSATARRRRSCSRWSRPTPATCWCSPAPSTAPIASCARSATPASRRSACTRTARSSSVARRSRASAAVATASWSRPTSRRAGSTSPTSSHVINYDLPQTVEDYVHRVGRTARAEADGRATSFAAPEERGQLHAIERHIGRALPRQTAPARAGRIRRSRRRSRPSGAASAATDLRRRVRVRPVDASGRDRRAGVHGTVVGPSAPRHSRAARSALADLGVEAAPSRPPVAARARRTRRAAPDC